MQEYKAEVRLVKKMSIEAETKTEAAIQLAKGRGKQISKEVENIFFFENDLPVYNFYKYVVVRDEKLKVDKLEQSTSHFTLSHGRLLPETVTGKVYVDNQIVLSFVLGQSLTVSSYGNFVGGISSVKIDYFSGKMEVTWNEVKSNRPFDIYVCYEHKFIPEEVKK